MAKFKKGDIVYNTGLGNTYGIKGTKGNDYLITVINLKKYGVQKYSIRELDAEGELIKYSRTPLWRKLEGLE